MNCQPHSDSVTLSEQNVHRPKLNVNILALIFCLAWILSACSGSAESSAVSAVKEVQQNAAIQSVAMEALQTGQDQLQALPIAAATPLAAVAQQAAAAPDQSAVPANQKQAADLSQSPRASSSGQAAPSTVNQPAPTDQIAQSASLPPAEPKVGFLAPDITLNALDGTSLRLSDLRGKNIIINYWVTWCIPCQDELPALSRVSQDYQDQNLVILTVNGIQQDQLDKVQQLVSDLGLINPVLLDEGEAFWSTYMVQFLPTSFFIDSQGIIRHIMLGSTSEDNLRAKINQLINNQF